MTGEVKGKYVKGKYRGKAINAFVKNGVITRSLNFGEHRIIWKNGEVLDVIKSERVRV